MTAHEIFQTLADERASSILNDVREMEPNSFKATLLTIAQHRRLRPVFVQKKPRPEQGAWLVKNLRMKSEDAIAEHILQIYLMKKHPDMLITFLDAAGIEHDGEGMIEDLPEELKADKVKAGADAIFGKFEQADASLYLHVFQMQVDGGWPEIAELLENDDRAKL